MDANLQRNFNSAIKYKILLNWPNIAIYNFFFYGTLYLQNMYMGSLTNVANKLLKYKPTTESIGCLETLVYEWI